MATFSIRLISKHIADAWLTASVHVDAFRAEPGAYLTAVKWRVKRKRVRAQAQFARLLALSPKAYTLWAMRQDHGRGAVTHSEDASPILALIDGVGEYRAADLNMTCDSLRREGIAALIIGSAETPTLADAAATINQAGDAWLFPLKPGDTVSPGMAGAYYSVMKDYRGHVIYADDDVISGHRRISPYFKPDWNAELFQHWDYLTGSCILRGSRDDLDVAGETPDWASTLARRLVDKGNPFHLCQMLHHRRKRPVPQIPAQPLVIERTLPPVSVVVPTRNRVDLLRTCLVGVEAAAYPDVEVIVMDNDSDDPETLAFLEGLSPTRYRVVRYGGPFNYSAINNRGVELARGRLICLLNNDVEMSDTCWLATLATQALRPEIGAVGARLLYPDGRIQHAGVVIGVGNAAGHAHRFLRPDEEGYFHHHNLPQFTMAVTAACLVVEREKFVAVGGLNAVDFPVAFNDVDLCLRLNQRGWQSLYEPRATLIHHESVSRGFDKDPVGAARFEAELAALKRIWKTDEVYDPYHHPQLSRASEQFAVAL